MDSEGNSGSSENKNADDINQKDKPASSKIKSTPRDRPKVIFSNRSAKKIAAMRLEFRIAIWVAIIGATATITAALIPIVNAMLQNSPIPTLVLTSTVSPMPSVTDTLTVLPTYIPSLTVSPTLTNTITVAPSDTPTITPKPNLIVLVAYDRSAGRPPLKVNFDARDSYLIDSDGQQLRCRSGACYYTWKVILNGRQLDDPATDTSGRFQYVFGKRGTFLVTVWICRGKDRVDCGGDGIYIVVG